MFNHINFLVLLCCLLCISLAPNAYAGNPQIERYIQGATKQGEMRLKYLLWDVYDATLYTSSQEYSDLKPFALRLDYLLDLQGADIAKRSIKEMRQQGFNDEEKLSAWLQKLNEIFPNVSNGDSITGIRDENGHAIFYMDEKKIGIIQDKEFAKRFFDIWLSEKTSDPDLRLQLLGLK